MMTLHAGLWGVLRPALGLLLACLALSAPARTLELRQAQVQITIQGQTTTQAASLPYHWDRLHDGQAGEATFELRFQLHEVPMVPYGLYLSRVGNVYEVWLNGALLQRKGDLLDDNGSQDYAKSPRHIEIAPGLLQLDNRFLVRIRADMGRRGGLAPLVLGPADQVRSLYLSDYRWRITGSLVVVVGSLLIGLATLALWATQVDVAAPGKPRRDALYLFAGLAELCWTVSVSDVLIENSPLPWPWWGVMPILAIAAWACSMALFCVEVAGWGRRPAVVLLRRWLALLLVGSVGAAIAALVLGHSLVLTLWYATLSLTFMVFVPLFIWNAGRGAALAHKLMAGALLFNTLVGLRDLYVFRISEAYGGNTMLRYSSLLFGLTLGYIVITRFRAASGQARDLSANLMARVAQKEQELAQSYQRMAQLAREQERSAERTRILRDMHDGVGSHISTAIRQLESGRASHGEVLLTLRDSLDQLKLSIDALNLPPGDVTALLANLRYRLEPRLTACDIALQWDVDLLPALERLDDKAMRHLQFMVFEALSNVMQHARATRLHIELRATGRGGAQLRVIDNGCGFEPAGATRRGLSSLRERAEAINAGLLIVSAPGNTMVQIVLD